MEDNFRQSRDSTCSEIKIQLQRAHEPVTDGTGATKFRNTYKIVLTPPSIYNGIKAKITFSVPVTLVTVRLNQEEMFRSNLIHCFFHISLRSSTVL